MDGSAQPDRRPPDDPAGGPGPLTARQAEVLTLLAAGLRLDAVASGLGVSREEVVEHLRAAIDALGASDLLHALILALRAGLIEPPPD